MTGESKSSDTFDEENVGCGNGGVRFSLPRPGRVERNITDASNDHTLSEASMMFDRNGKGYLDQTERALRKLDSDNKGFLDINKIYFIMESLQSEQKKSALLIDTIRTEQKKSMNLKKGIYALCIFAILLALSNVGTSFAAAKLAKDTNVSMSSDLVEVGTGERIGTTNKVVSFNMESVNSESRRRLIGDRLLQDTETFVCSKASNSTKCKLQGTINYQDVRGLYRKFCPNWKLGEKCVGGGVAAIDLVCNGVISKIIGGGSLPRKAPARSEDYIIFPSVVEGFATEQVFSTGLGKSKCVQDFDMNFYCDGNVAENGECIVFAFYETSKCNQDVILCGES